MKRSTRKEYRRKVDERNTGKEYKKEIQEKSTRKEYRKKVKERNTGRKYKEVQGTGTRSSKKRRGPNELVLASSSFEDYKTPAPR